MGAESVTFDGNLYPKMHPAVNGHAKAAECNQTMGETSENVSSDFNITRKGQDHFAEESCRKQSWPKSPAGLMTRLYLLTQRLRIRRQAS
jgi:hypothetical protein